MGRPASHVQPLVSAGSAWLPSVGRCGYHPDELFNWLASRAVLFVRCMYLVIRIQCIGCVIYTYLIK